MSVWALAYEGFEPEQERLREALCTLGNGYFATRGAAPWASADEVHYPGTYVAGCYNRLRSSVAGETVENESLVNAPNWLPLRLRIEDEPWLDLKLVDVLAYRQELDLRRGVLTRSYRVADARRRRTSVEERRFVSMADPHLAGLELTVRPENWSGRVTICSALDGRVRNDGVARYRELDSRHLDPVEGYAFDGDCLFLEVETTQSRIRLAESARTRVLRGRAAVSAARRASVERGYVAHELDVEIEEGEPLVVEKIAALFTSRDVAISESGLESRKWLRRAGGFDELLEKHELAWNGLWERSCLWIADSVEDAARTLHLHIFHILQTVSEHTGDLDAGIPARGLHGEAYRGHVFWDELFVFPFLNLHLPELTRDLLRYRYRRLPEARRAARDAGYAGAMFPWQSGSNGEEETQTLHLNPLTGRWMRDNSHLQRHISAAIAYNAWQYYQVSGDLNFLVRFGAELILEIARFWATIAAYEPERQRYEIRGVVGPDEYHDGYPGAEKPGLDNNAYTNVMAAWVLWRALDLLDLLPSERRAELWGRLRLSDPEVERWRDVSSRLYVPFHDEGIISQFEGYERLEELDWRRYRAEHGEYLRLDRILNAEGDTPNRYKASKQADALMLFYLFSTEELQAVFGRLGYAFEPEQIPSNIDYYIERTSHGSTLSGVVHSWVLARGDRERSWQFFRRALESDVSDIQGGTTPEGVHLGAMAGTVDLVQRCYTGLELREDVLWLNPRLPEEVQALSFEICYRGNWIGVELTADRAILSVRAGGASPVNVGFCDRVVAIPPGERRELAIPPAQAAASV